MILNGENGQSFMAQTGDGLVIEIDMRNFDCFGQTVRVDGETVIMRGDFDFAGRQIHNRLIAAAMSEF